MQSRKCVTYKIYIIHIYLILKLNYHLRYLKPTDKNIAISYLIFNDTI